MLQFQNLDAFNTDHNSLELALDKRYSNRWSGRLAYTLAYSNDVQAATQGGFNLSLKRFSDDLDPRSDYGRAAFDNRHALVTSTYVTAWRGLGFGAVYKFYSGLPINETVGSDVNGDRDNVDRPVKGVHDATRPIVSEVDASGRAIRNGIDGPNIMQRRRQGPVHVHARQSAQPGAVLGNLQRDQQGQLRPPDRQPAQQQLPRADRGRQSAHDAARRPVRFLRPGADGR